jgi:hypothetical protein
VDMNDHGGIDLSIGELVIDGVPGIVGDQVERALRHELGRLLSAAPPGALRAHPAERLGPVELRLSPGVSSTVLGHRLAHAIHGALRRT